MITFEFADMATWAAWHTNEVVQTILDEVHALASDVTLELRGRSPVVPESIRPGGQYSNRDGSARQARLEIQTLVSYFNKRRRIYSRKARLTGLSFKSLKRLRLNNMAKMAIAANGIEINPAACQFSTDGGS